MPKPRKSFTRRECDACGGVAMGGTGCRLIDGRWCHPLEQVSERIWIAVDALLLPEALKAGLTLDHTMAPECDMLEEDRAHMEMVVMAIVRAAVNEERETEHTA